jgi:hypothetical protein
MTLSPLGKCGMIVICSKEDDPHASAVARILESKHKDDVFIFDTSTYPRVALLNATFDNDGCASCVLTTPKNQRIKLLEVKSFWWRRPQPVCIDPGIIDSQAQRFTFNECISALYGVMQCSEGLWVNDLHRDGIAEYKAFQLKVARRIGFRLPRTLITSDPEEVIEFWRQEDQAVVYKAFNERGIAWCPTRRLNQDDLRLIDHIRHAPVIFQRLVPGIRDIRVTVIGKRMFATEFDIQEMEPVDYRVDMQRLPCRPHRLPEEMSDKINMFMCALGLEYGGIDFRLTKDGAYVFFEINTAGEFMYLEERTGQPIAEAIASHLDQGKRVNLPTELPQ